MTATSLELMRLITIHQEIARKAYPSVKELAAQCDLHPRSIKRLIHRLRTELHAPIATRRPQGGYYYTALFSPLPPPFNGQELLALTLALQISDTFQHTPFAPALQGALQKVRAFFPEAVTPGDAPLYISDLGTPAPPDGLLATVAFATIIQAIDAHHSVHLRYYALSHDVETQRTVDPYHLYRFAGMWYLYGYCHLRRQERDFALPRIRHITQGTGVFTPPDPAAIAARLQARFGNITDTPVAVQIWFAPPAARRVQERVWHPSQQVTQLPDGAVILTLTVTGLAMAVRWVLGYGAEARPLTPPSFVARYAAEVEGMRAHLAARPPENK